MIVIAVIGLLASIAVPTYSSYVNQAKFGEIILSSEPAKTAIELCIQKTNDISECDNNIELGPHGFNETRATTQELVQSIVISSLGAASILISVTPINATSIGSNILPAHDYILVGSVGYRGTDAYIESWSRSLVSGCIDVGYC